MQLEAEELQIAYLQLTDYQGKPYAIAVDTATGIPVLVTMQDSTTGRFVWHQATLRRLADKRALTIGVTLPISYVQSWHKESSKMELMVSNNFNQFQMGYDLMWWNPDFNDSSVRPTRDSYNFMQPHKSHKSNTKVSPPMAQRPEFEGRQLPQ